MLYYVISTKMEDEHMPLPGPQNFLFDAIVLICLIICFDLQGSFKMVVSAYTLMDQPNRLARLSLVDSLFNLTEEYLVSV